MCEVYICKCGSANVVGLVAGFWAELDEHGGMKNDFAHHSSDTELGPERMCLDCGHEWGGDKSIEAVLAETKRQRDDLLDALIHFKIQAGVAYDYWDADQDSKVGKRLLALAGRLPGYHKDIDAAHAAIAKTEERDRQ